MSSLLSASDKIKVQVGRMGASQEEVKLEKGAIVKEAVEKAKFVVGPKESVYLNSTKLGDNWGEQKLHNGDLIVIAGAKEGGIN